jgi:hypothetical protein
MPNYDHYDGKLAAALRTACKEAGVEIRVVEPKRSNAGLSGYRALARQMWPIVKEVRRLEAEAQIA